MTVISKMENVSVKIKTEPNVEIKQEDIATDNEDFELNLVRNSASNVMLPPKKYFSNSALIVKAEPDSSQFIEENDIKIKVEESSSDELGDHFIETCIKSETLGEYDHQKHRGQVNVEFFNSEYKELYIAEDSKLKSTNVKDEEDLEIEEPKLEEDVEFNVKQNIKDDEEVDIENTEVRRNIELKRYIDVNVKEYNHIHVKEDVDIKGDTDIDVEEGIELKKIKISLEINENNLEYNDRTTKGNDSNKSKAWFKCTFCTYKTQTQGSFKKHFTLHEDPNKVPLYFCTKCSYKTKQKCHLKRHDLVHQTNCDDALNFVCGICGFRTKQKCTLKRHIVTVHRKRKQGTMNSNKSADEIFVCEKCSYTTYNKGLLISHMDKHKDTRDVQNLYICDVCSFSTKYRRNLKVHLETHKELQKRLSNECKICSFKTRLPYCLKRHLLSRKHLLAVGKIDEYSPRTLKS